MHKKLILPLMAALIACNNSFAADAIVDQNPEIPEPPVHLSQEGAGIWGALAYSATDRKQGMFWGGTTREEAETAALKHCENAKGQSCTLVETFRNHRHWSDDDGLFPYNQCAALAVSPSGTAYGSATATSIKSARSEALAQCGDNNCKVVEAGCT